MDEPRPKACNFHRVGRARSPLRAMNWPRRILRLCGVWKTARTRSLDIFGASASEILSPLKRR